MRHVRDVMRLKSAGMPTREIARRVGTAPSTVRLTIRRFEAAGLSWPLSDDVTDAVLEEVRAGGVFEPVCHTSILTQCRKPAAHHRAHGPGQARGDGFDS